MSTTDESADHGDRPRPTVAARNEAAVRVAGTLVQAHAIEGGVHLSAARPSGVMPRQLPAPPPLFVGRTHELSILDAALETGSEQEAIAVSAVGGAGGIGKTALALRWAHQRLDRFPDGQLYVNLRGFDPSGSALPPAVALSGFLDALGVDPTLLPRDENARVGLYRSLLATRRMLIVLDNAKDAAQVIPLLPASATCAVLVTSRRRLTGLATEHGARLIDLDMLSKRDAQELLAGHLGVQRLCQEHGVVAELLALCAGLPLALRIVAARLAHHPGFPLAVLADELRDATCRIDGLDACDMRVNLRAVLSWSFDALEPRETAVFCLLGVNPGVDIDLEAIAALTDLCVRQARCALRELEAVSLVQEYQPGRFRLHDLVRLYAGEVADREIPAAQQASALCRLFAFYRQATVECCRSLSDVSKIFGIPPA